MSKIFSTLAIALVLACASPQAQAISINFVPSTSHVAVGGVVNIDVVVSGLDAASEIVSAFDLNVLFNGGVVNAFAVTHSAVPLFGGIGLAYFNAQFGAGNVGATDGSLLTDDDALAALQGDTFTLLTLSFQGLADGFTLLQFGPDADFDRNVVGRNALSLLAQFGTACIAVGDGQCRIAVSEPDALPLLLAGLALLAAPAVRRRLTRNV